nr:MAG TPA: hypothetical protein [Crassvirales sp.]
MIIFISKLCVKNRLSLLCCDNKGDFLVCNNLYVAWTYISYNLIL